MDRRALSSKLTTIYTEYLGVAAEFVIEDAFALIDAHPEWRSHPQLLRGQSSPTKPGIAAPAAASAVAMFSPAEVNGMIGAGKDRLSGVLIKGVSDMAAEKTKQTLALPELTKQGFDRMWNLVMASVVIGLVVAGYLALKLPTAITKPIATLSGAIDRVSKGELDVAIDTSGPSEFSTLTAAVERMRVAQGALVARLRSRAS
jgi:methyl-accepting chemotaxis protein